MTSILFATKDRVNPTNNPQLFAGISASTLSIILKTGHGAWLPQPYNGSATSGGSATTLNSTGVLAVIGSGSVGKYIRNVTDGSSAKITAVGTDSVTTTPLLGGTTNLWNNADAWRIDEFVLTLAKVDSDGIATQTEQVLCIARATDTVTVAAGGRGYNGSTANTFAADDYAYLLVTSPIIEGLKSYIGDLVSKVYANTTDLSTAQSDIDNLEAGGAFWGGTATGSSNAYAVSIASFPAAYSAKNIVFFLANFANTGSATLNVNSLGAKTIKRFDGATNLVAGDIQNGQLVGCVYDGTNMQMFTPIGQVGQTETDPVKYSNFTDSTAIGASSTAEADFSNNTSIGSNVLTAGASYEFFARGVFTVQAGQALTIRLKIGSVTIGTATGDGGSARTNGMWEIKGWFNVRSTGGSGTIVSSVNGNVGATKTDTLSTAVATIDTTASNTFKATGQFDTSNASNSAKLIEIVLRRYN